MYFVDIMDGMLTSFMGTKDQSGNDLGTTDNRPRNLNFGDSTLGQVLNFAQTMYKMLRWKIWQNNSIWKKP